MITAGHLVLAWMKDFDITVNPGSGNRGSQQFLELFASQPNAHDVKLDWNIQLDQEVLKQGEMTEESLHISLAQQATGIYHLILISQDGKRYLLKLVKQ